MDYKYLRMNNRRYRLWDWRDACDGCPNCGKNKLNYVSVIVQFGLTAHRVTTYCTCYECHHRFAWHETAHMSASMLHENITLFRPSEELEF